MTTPGHDVMALASSARGLGTTKAMPPFEVLALAAASVAAILILAFDDTRPSGPRNAITAIARLAS